MAPAGRGHKRSPPVYPSVGGLRRLGGKIAMMGLALGMFIGLFAFGQDLLGWVDPDGQVQMGLFMSFLFGTICGYRTRG
jgi:hypothetical protein